MEKGGKIILICLIYYTLMKHIKNIVKFVLNTIFGKYIIYKHAGNDRKISLTFDDGPVAANTELVLDVLKAENVKAVFFVLGKHVVAHPEIVRRIHNEGHEIGIHGYDHLSAKSGKNISYIKGVEDTALLLEKITGSYSSKLFRPPYGDITVYTFIKLISKGYRYIMWSYDSLDSFIKDKNDLLISIKANQPSNGAITLFHDDYDYTAELLKEILIYWKSLGFEFVKVS